MTKSKTQYNNPQTWLAVSASTMQADPGGMFVRLDEYNKLLEAYKGALCQLDRASEMIKNLKLARPTS